MTKIFTVKNAFFFNLHQEGTKLFLMSAQPLHVGLMNTGHWDEEGQVFHKI